MTRTRIGAVFASRAFDPGALEVLAFRGREEISRPFRFEIDLTSADPDLDLDAGLHAPATLRVRSGTGARHIHGVLAELDFCGEAEDGGTRYRALLVPRLWLLGLSRESRIWQHATVPGIVGALLAEAGIDAGPGTPGLARRYREREYTVQFRESALDFASRLLEHEGIHFHFAHEGDRERIVLGDTNACFPALADDPHVPCGRDADGAAVRALRCRRRRTPREVVLCDRDEDAPHVPLVGGAQVDARGWGRLSEEDANPGTPEEAAALARVRAEELRAGAETFRGEGDHPLFRAGCRFRPSGHPRRGFDRALLLARVDHRFDARTGYHNTFTAVPEDAPFRPARRTPRPRLPGALRAAVDASGPDGAAHADAQGRYRLRMPFDESGAGAGRATRPVRMAGPWGGPDRGVHLPLPEGAEVVWTGIDGDPDRPVITGSVAETGGALAAPAGGRAVIRTPGGARLELGGADAPPEPWATPPGPRDALVEPRHLQDLTESVDDPGMDRHHNTFFKVSVPHNAWEKNTYLRLGESDRTESIERDRAVLDGLAWNDPARSGVPEDPAREPESDTPGDYAEAVKAWGLAGVFDYTGGNRTVITRGNKEEVIHGASRTVVKQGTAFLEDSQPYYSVEYRPEGEFLGQATWRKTEKMFVKSDTYAFGDTEEFFGGFKFEGMGGLATSFFLGGKVDIAPMLALDVRGGFNMALGVGVDYELIEGKDLNVSKRAETKARESVKLRVKSESSFGGQGSHALRMLGLLAAAGLTAGGMGAIAGAIAGRVAIDGAWSDGEISKEDEEDIAGAVVGSSAAVFAAGLALATYLAMKDWKKDSAGQSDSEVLLTKREIKLSAGSSQIVLWDEGTIFLGHPEGTVHIAGDLMVTGEIYTSGGVKTSGPVVTSQGARIANPGPPPTQAMEMEARAGAVQIEAEERAEQAADLAQPITG